ncbi:MAG: hypothetical protein WDN75_16400 [Bacteroidota bacterium]
MNRIIDHAMCFHFGRILWASIFGKDPEGLTDFEFASSSVLNCSRTIKRPRTLDDIIAASTHVDPKSRMNIKELKKALEGWVVPEKLAPNESLVQRIVNEPTTVQLINVMRKGSEIQEATKKRYNILETN